MITGEQIRDARKRAGLSQAELAKRVGVVPRTVGGWERGENAPGIAEPRLLEVLREQLAGPAGSETSLRDISDVELLAEVARRLGQAARREPVVGPASAGAPAVVADPQLFLTQIEKRLQPRVQQRLFEELKRVGARIADDQLFEVVANSVDAIHTTNFDGLLEATHLESNVDFSWEDGEGNVILVEVKDHGPGSNAVEVREVLDAAMESLDREDRPGGWRAREADADAREVGASWRIIERGAVARQKRDLARQRQQRRDGEPAVSDVADGGAR